MSDYNYHPVLLDIDKGLERVATTLERVAELLANPKHVVTYDPGLPIVPCNSRPMQPYAEPRPSHWPVTPVQPRDPRPSTITM